MLYFRMGKLVAVVCLVLLFSCGVENFKMSKKDFELLENVLEFGVQVFLNCLDKLRDIIERMVKTNQLRTNRIEIQGRWNSFKETANRISVEERGKGEQDDLLTAARTIRRLLLFYKEDLQSMIRSLTAQEGVQRYLPTLNMLEGVIEKEKWNELLGTVESHYFPGAPSLKNEPSEFLCYLLSTNTMETFIVKILKIGVDVIFQSRKIDFQTLQDKLHSAVEAISMKAYEFERVERQKENDDLLVVVRVATRVCLFYWDQFLEYTQSPEFSKRVHQAEDAFQNGTFHETMKKMEELIQPIRNSELFKEASQLHWDYFSDIYIAVFTTALRPLTLIGEDRKQKTTSALENGAVVVCAPIWAKLYEMNVFPAIETLYYRTANILLALIGEKTLETLRGVVMKHWKPFKEEAYRVIQEERQKTTTFLLPQVRAFARLLSYCSNQLLKDRIDGYDTTQLEKTMERMRKICTENMLAKGLITQEELKTSEKVLEEGVFELLNLTDEQGMRDSLRTLYKASLVFLNFIYAPLHDVWKFISV